MKVERTTKVVTYHKHNCARHHRTYRAVARCIWPNAVWIRGDAPYANVSYCRKKYIRGDQTSVELHDTLDSADNGMYWIDSYGCGGGCSGNHRLVSLKQLLQAARKEQECHCYDAGYVDENRYD